MILDGQAQLGPMLTEHDLSIYPSDSAADLLRSYDEQGISGGLVHAASAAFSEVTPDYIAANNYAQAQVREHTTLHGALRVNPNARGSHDEHVRAAVEEGSVKALVFAPLEDGFAVDDARLGRYLDLARRHGLLTVFLLGNFHHRDTMPLRLKGWLYDYPDVPVLLTQIAYRTQSDAVMIAQDHANVYLGTSDSTMLFLLNTVERLGAKRFVFTTNFPFSIPALEVMKINKLPISEEDKERILHRNLSELINKETAK